MAFVFDEAWINNGQLVVASDTVKPPGQGLGSTIVQDTLHILVHIKLVKQETSILNKAL